MAAAAALFLAPLALPAAADTLTNFRGGGHVGNFVNCPGWNVDSIPVTARSQILGDAIISVNIFTPDWAIGWREFGEPDEDGWQEMQQTEMFSGSFTRGAEIRILNLSPSEIDADTEDFNGRARIRGWPSPDPDCRADIRLQMRAQQ